MISKNGKVCNLFERWWLIFCMFKGKGSKGINVVV